VDAEWENLKKEIAREAAHLRDRKEGGGSSTTSEDFFKQYRTNTVMLWLFSNGLLCYIMTSPAVISAIFPNSVKKSNVNPYLTFLFWSVTFLSLFRLICSSLYLYGWIAEALEDSGKRNPVNSLKHEVKMLIKKDERQDANA
jgi:chitin synthase